MGPVPPEVHRQVGWQLTISCSASRPPPNWFSAPGPPCLEHTDFPGSRKEREHWIRLGGFGGSCLFSSSEISGPASQVFKAPNSLMILCSVPPVRAFRGLPPAHKAHAPCASSFRGSAEPDPNSFEAFLLASSHHHHPPSHPVFSLLSPMVYTMALFAPITHATLLAAMPSLQSLLHCHHLPLARSPRLK